jgi:hypothetical protein
MGPGFKRKASEEVATPESGQQASKKARTDSPEKEVSDSDPGENCLLALTRSSAGKWPS